MITNLFIFYGLITFLYIVVELIRQGPDMNWIDVIIWPITFPLIFFKHSKARILEIWKDM